MTMAAVILIGAGILFISSALDNTPLVQTFQKIVSGQAINWAGNTPGSTTGATTTSSGSNASNPSTGSTGSSGGFKLPNNNPNIQGV